MAWGPSHQTTPVKRDWRRPLLAVLTVLGLVDHLFFCVLAAVGLVLWARRFHRACRWLVDRAQRFGVARVAEWRELPDPYRVGGIGGRVYLGGLPGGGCRLSAPQRAVLVLGPPRSGKTSGVMVPSLLVHRGAAVCTSTKPDVLESTAGARAAVGRVWQFDPTGTIRRAAGVEELRWSPLQSAAVWDSAMVVARAMVTGAGVGRGTTDSSHWARRAQALLAPMLHAAAVSDRDVAAVLGWVVGHELDEPLKLLELSGSPVATVTLAGVGATEGRERSSIFSAAADALDAYTSEGALDAAGEPNFDPSKFVLSAGTVYVHAAAERQQLAAPLVCGLLSDIRRATYRLHAADVLREPVLFALDEVANIAPLDELPQIASEGGSQGLLLLAAIQDLSQARNRWGTLADGFLTLFGDKLLLPGIADQQTLETVSVMLGEYDRRVVSNTHTHTAGDWFPRPTFGQRSNSHTVATQRTRVLSPGEVAGIPQGHALHLNGTRWELLALTPAHACEPWRSLTDARVNASSGGGQAGR